MIHYLLSVILATAWLYLAYHILLASTTTFRFNRFYLLLCVLLPFIFPIISIFPDTFSTSAIQIADGQNSQVMSVASSTYASPDPIPWLFLAIFLYSLVTLVLAIRFIVNVSKILRCIRTHAITSIKNLRLIHITADQQPYSFFNYIFLPKSIEGTLSTEILTHEMTHVRQGHSLDIIFIELMIIIFWFNPVLYLIGRSIRLNHEFLADRAVARTHSSVSKYQYLLIEQSAKRPPSALTSTFHYQIIKKRLIMMTKSTSITNQSLRLVGLMPVILLSIFLFAQPVIAQQTEEKVKPATPNEQGEGASAQEVSEYNAIVLSNRNKDGYLYIELFSESERARLKELFLKMTEEQRSQQRVTFLKHPGPLKSVKPDMEMLNDFLNPEKYGIWIDNRRVENEAIAQYSPEDFGNVFISKLMPNATNYGVHEYQVNLETVSVHERRRKLSEAVKGEYVIKVPFIKI